MNDEKTALVLAGGGLTGAVYEIGALRAIDDMLVDRTVNDFDIYVGTSAGAFVCSLLANGIGPVEMLQVIDGSHAEMQPLQRSHIFGINQRDWLHWISAVPGKVLSGWAEYLTHAGDMTLFDLLWTLSEALPAGLYDNLALERFVRKVLKGRQGASNEFDLLQRELYIIATELGSGERVVFGKEDGEDISISLAVAASSALPLVYKPLRIGEKEYVDGGLRGNASLDMAIEKGATLVVCINPMVPLNHAALARKNHKESHYLSEKGIRLVADQTLRILGYSGLQYHVKQLRRRHPEVDIVLIEPQADASDMFYYNIMRYSSRLKVARHGFESVTLDLAADYSKFKEILSRHKIPITRRLVIEELSKISQSNYDPEVVRHVLEARSPGFGREQMDSPFCRLNRTLADLEMTLDQMEHFSK